MKVADLMTKDIQEKENDYTLCPVCHKKFYITDNANWCYKIKSKRWATRFMCSWTCFRKAEDAIERRHYRSVI